MENNDFDKFIRGKIENLKVEYNAEDWNKLKSELDADIELSEGMDDLYFDGIVYENLSKIEVPYNSDHWEVMSERLHPAKAFMAKLRRYKIAEMALVALAIFTFLQLFPPKPKHAGSQFTATLSDSVTTSDQSLNHHKTNENSTILEASSATDITDHVSASILTNTSKEITDISEATKQNDLRKAVLSSVKKSAAAEQLNAGVPGEHSYNYALANELINFSDEPKQIIATIQNSSSNKTEDWLNENNNLSLLLLPEIPPSLLDMDWDQAVEPCVLCNKRSLLHGIRIGMFASSEANYIMTPFDSKYEESSYEQLTFGYGGGVTIGFKFKRWEIETGAMYSYKFYAPKLNVTLDQGSFEEGYTGVALRSAELNMLEIPFNLHYKLKRYNKWAFYGLGGGSFNLAYQANYDLIEYTVDRRGNSPYARNSFFIDQPLNYRKHYFSANLGLGVERFFNTRWSMFVQPNYKHQLISKGIGPNLDRINSFSIFGGVKASL